MVFYHAKTVIYHAYIEKRFVRFYNLMENITKSFHENYTSLYSNYQALDKKNSEKCIRMLFLVIKAAVPLL